MKRVVVLVGGVGGAKLAYGLAKILAPEQLTIIVNTGDDFSLYGLRISPDLDTIMYTLAGLVDKTNGWGVGGDTKHMLEALRGYGEDAWFGLGDKDLATHLLRTQWLHEGQTLTEVTRRLTTALGIEHQILPMANEPVATMVDTVEYGELAFQTYFVRYRWQPIVRSLRFEGAEHAQITPEAQTAIEQADAILIAPSNPWLSIAPILSVPGIREAIINRDVPRIAITPLIAGQAVKGPIAKLMAELGYETNIMTIADYYDKVVNSYVYDEQDVGTPLPAHLRTTMMNTFMQSENDRVQLARNVLVWAKGF